MSAGPGMSLIHKGNASHVDLDGIREHMGKKSVPIVQQDNSHSPEMQRHQTNVQVN